MEDKSIVAVDRDEMPERYRQVFKKMDDYHCGRISWAEFKKVPQEDLIAARRWQAERDAEFLDEMFPDVEQ